MNHIIIRVLLGISLSFGLVAAPSVGYTAEGDAEFSVSPDSAYPLLESAIKNARSSIKINIYMITSKIIAEQLMKKAKSGLEVIVLVEGQPHGGTVLPLVKELLEQMDQSFEQSIRKRSKILVMTGERESRRYVYNHAKYALIDNRIVFVSSDNFTGSAFPNHKLEGGTRGWQAKIENRKLANEVNQLYKRDTDLKNPDVKLLKDADLKVNDPFEGEKTTTNQRDKRKERTQDLFSFEKGKVKSAELCMSPKATACLVDFIRSAKTELLVEHLSLPEVWYNFERRIRSKNPILEEYVAAAKRGVHVRILLNDETVYSNSEDKEEESKNSNTVKVLNAMAKRMGIPLEAALFNAKNLGVKSLHNKGMVADRSRAFVSSINGTENSVMNNREMAVAMDSVDAGRYFSEVFEYDWKMSTNP
ncbi:MAG: phospholipase D-like domain-containing protein [Oligoflexia bacterium]|nr:phospholipase D-like domain-containing protein [Oligoflexia bacterium]